MRFNSLDKSTLLKDAASILAAMISQYESEVPWALISPRISGFQNGQERANWTPFVLETKEISTALEFLTETKRNETTFRIAICCTPTEPWVAKGSQWQSSAWHVWAVALGKERDAGRKDGWTIYIWDDGAATKLQGRAVGYREDLLHHQRAMLRILRNHRGMVFNNVYLGGSGDGQDMCMRNTFVWLDSVLQSSSKTPVSTGTEILASSELWTPIRWTSKQPTTKATKASSTSRVADCLSTSRVTRSQVQQLSHSGSQ